MQHLDDSHQIMQEQDRIQQCKRYWLSPLGDKTFWCGFCREIKRQRNTGVDGWRDLYDHIYGHIQGGWSVDEDWYSAGYDIPNGVVKEITRGTVNPNPPTIESANDPATSPQSLPSQSPCDTDDAFSVEELEGKNR